MPEGVKRDGMGWDGMRSEAKGGQKGHGQGSGPRCREAAHSADRRAELTLGRLGPGALPRRHVHGRTYERRM